MESVLKKTKNWYRCVGTVYEKALKREDCKVKLYSEGKPTGEEVNAECIKGNVAVRTDNGIITFNVYFASKNMQGENSRDWPMAVAMLENWNPEMNGLGEPPTLVNISGTIEPNDYKDGTGTLRYNLRYRVKQANTRVEPDSPKAMSIQAVAFINNIRQEIFKEEETGRLIVELLGANNKGECFPITTIVEADSVDDFTEIFEKEQTANFSIDVIVRHIGNANKDKKAFGKKSSVDVNAGFDITELVIMGADEPIEEPDELTTTDENGNEVELPTEWINPVTMKKALKMRKQKLDEMEKSNGSYSSGKPMSYKERKEKAQKKMDSKVSTVMDVEDDDDFPEEEY